MVLGGCAGNCPSLAIEVDSSLQFNYFCLSGCDDPGHQIGAISQSFFDSLHTLLAGSSVELPNASYDYRDSTVYVEIKYHITNNSFTGTGNLRKWPAPIQKVIMLLLDKSKAIPLTQNTNIDTWEMELKVPMDDYFKLPYPQKDSSNN